MPWLQSWGIHLFNPWRLWREKQLMFFTLSWFSFSCIFMDLFLFYPNLCSSWTCFCVERWGTVWRPCKTILKMIRRRKKRWNKFHLWLSIFFVADMQFLHLLSKKHFCFAVTNLWGRWKKRLHYLQRAEHTGEILPPAASHTPLSPRFLEDNNTRVQKQEKERETFIDVK